jgi:hypothetical protein
VACRVTQVAVVVNVKWETIMMLMRSMMGESTRAGQSRVTVRPPHEPRQTSGAARETADVSLSGVTRLRRESERWLARGR